MMQSTLGTIWDIAEMMTLTQVEEGVAEEILLVAIEALGALLGIITLGVVLQWI